ncbi:MAG: chemotaxis protein CheA [Rhizorhabdus sp.]|nr:chemotaxis protein CheA [Rhizorhabdus sp.]
MDDLLGDFIAETRETLQALAGEIVAWEAAPEDRFRLDAIFRFVHTVKGSCGFLDLPRLEKLSHAAEDVLADLRDGRRKPDARIVSAVLAVIDRIAELTDAIETGHPPANANDTDLIAALADRIETPAEPVATQATNAVSPRTVSRSIRLPVDLLDRMMAGVSDMVLARNEVARKLRDAGAASSVELAFERLSSCIAEMRDAITRTRMARIEHLFTALPRMVRDTSNELGKQIQLEIDGGDVELDREMIEMIRDPLTHIVRNAIDHGIETPDLRLHAGKPVAGRLHVSARQVGNHILIEVIDDGRGIDADALVQKAIKNGILTEDRAALMSWERKLQLIFEPGLSTAKQVTAISGRGVGMDVVRANVERIGGHVEIDSKPGQGLHLTLRVPLTLTIIPALTISCGDQQFAIPRSAIEEIVRVGGEAVRISTLGGAPVVFIRGVRLPVVSLAGIVGLAEPADRPNLVVVKLSGGSRYALSVEAVHDHEELVVKPAAPIVMASGIYGGTTLPDNSRPMLLLDVAAIAERAGINWKQANADAGEADVEAVIAKAEPVLLFRDLDGVERGVPLALIERIEDCQPSAVHHSAGRQRLCHENKLLPLVTCGAPVGFDRVRVLRMCDGAIELAYAIDGVIDIIPLDIQLQRASTAGLVAGVMLVDERPIEFLDPFWIFGQASEPVAASGGPLCLLAEDTPWTRQVLAPMVESVGYRVAFPGDAVEPPAVTIVADDGSMPHIAGHVVRLRLTSAAEGASPDSVWRYDRGALTAELRRHWKRSAA